MTHELPLSFNCAHKLWCTYCNETTIVYGLIGCLFVRFFVFFSFVLFCFCVFVCCCCFSVFVCWCFFFCFVLFFALVLFLPKYALFLPWKKHVFCFVLFCFHRIKVAIISLVLLPSFEIKVSKYKMKLGNRKSKPQLHSPRKLLSQIVSRPTIFFISG